VKRHPSGLSLAEVILAFGLLAVAILSLIGVATSGLGLMARGNELTTATSLGHEFLERVRADPSGLPSAGSFLGSVPTPLLDGFPPSPYPGETIQGQSYTINVTTEPVPDTERLVAVEVVVRWGERSQVRLVSYVLP